MKKSSKSILYLTIIILIITVTILIGIIMNLLKTNKILTYNEINKKQLEETTNNETYIGAQSHFKQLKDEQEKLLSFKSSIATAITNEGISTSSSDTASTMASNISNILKTKTILSSDVAATADNISHGKQAWVNGELITGNVISNNGYRIDITITCYFSGYDGYNTTNYANGNGMKQTHTHSILINSLEDITYENLVLNTIYGGGHRNGNPTTGTPAAFYTIDSIRITQL